ncbi:sensor histidine kinase [Leucobacter chromiiresistens]|uniref:histidine kinase n=1 Tax=Leucobacter chromiiresistens TaxID=1079994 RepID=A0A1H0ZE61_9MICO|nr:HAMP domain-containing sensor histidine kinase [Leucobacter chromiiresistens]SDQ25436.1 two-component system, OmpR family, sensor histidine kinase VanS [Leucobacter chromiiresistens]
MPLLDDRARRRRPGPSVRAKLTLSYVAVLMLTGGLLLAVVYLFLLRYVPPEASSSAEGFFPGRNDLIRAFVPAAAWTLLALLGVSAVGGWVLAGYMLGPLAHITRATRAAAAGSLGHRIGLPGRADEFRELADSFDEMLGRLEAQLAEQQRFAANASHELRTPLAITQTLLEVAESDPDADHAATLARLRGVNSRAIQLTEALLTLSRAEQRVLEQGAVDLSLLAEEAAEELLPLAEQRGVALQVSGEQALALGSRSLLLQVVANLVHNAISHNSAERPGDGGFVRVWTGAEAGAEAPGAGADAPGAVVLRVENSGAPFPQQRVAMLTEPFQRGAERVRSDHAGFGLGLAIVQSVVRAHRGALDLVARAEGGLVVTVVLPAGPPLPPLPPASGVDSGACRGRDTH